MDRKMALTTVNLRESYQVGSLTPSSMLEVLAERIEAYPDAAVWIHRLPWVEIRARASELEAAWKSEKDPVRRFPLYGLPFAVKDNIDVAGCPTTAACPGFAYVAGAHAPVVARLLDAGALFIGKTNMDQFATGLVGTRSPYGAVRNPFHPNYVSGGSSSGSAVAVAAGLVSFALGTDTAGSGRVPAGFNNIVGLKPTRGLVSARGVVPACRSLDCVSVFALTCEDAFEVLRVMQGPDGEDPYSRAVPEERRVDAQAFTQPPRRFRFGVPDPLEFFGHEEYASLFRQAVANLMALGGEAVVVPFQDFAAAAKLLYEGPWVSERWAAFGSYVEQHPDQVLPVIRKVVEPGKSHSAASAFEAQYRLAALKSRCERILTGVDCLVVPTAPAPCRVADAAADPIASNSRLGTYTNFVNLLDMCGLALPSGFQADGLPFGITLLAPAFHEGWLASLGAAYQAYSSQPPGTMGACALPRIRPVIPEDSVSLAVAGLHLSGQPLNGQLTSLGARLRGAFKTAPNYRLYALRRGERHFPGVVRQASGGASLDVEVWILSRPALGRFMAHVKAPLGIGSVELDTGETVQGFLCEAYALDGAEEITRHGGWLSYLASL